MLRLKGSPIRNFLSRRKYGCGSNAWWPVSKKASLCGQSNQIGNSKYKPYLLSNISSTFNLFIKLHIIEIIPWILATMISVAREMRNPVKAPVESILHAKKARKQSGVTDLSLQSKTPRTSSSILRIVLGSNMYLAPSICIFIHHEIT